MTTADPPSDNPWPGLGAYDEAMADVFFGRTGPAEDLLRLVRREAATVLFGESGLGKTSLLQAGIAPALRAEGFLPIFIRLAYDNNKNSLCEQLRHALVQAVSEVPEAVAVLEREVSVWHALHSRAFPTVADDSSVVPILIFDQFEELFSRKLAGIDEVSERLAFIEELADLIENRPPAALRAAIEERPERIADYDLGAKRFRLIFAIREDRLSHLEEIRMRALTLGRNRLRLTRLNGGEAFQAVIEPGEHVLTPGQAEEIVRIVAVASEEHDEPGHGNVIDDSSKKAREVPLDQLELDPSLLSLVCHELYNRRFAKGLGWSNAQELKSEAATIIEDFYDRQMADMPQAVHELIENDLISGDGSLRIDMPVKDFVRKTSQHDLDLLVERRILRIEDRQHKWVELIHDHLVKVVARRRSSRSEAQQFDEKMKADKAVADREMRRWRLRVAGAAIVAATMIILLFSFVLYGKYKARTELERRRLYACVVTLAPRSSLNEMSARYNSLAKLMPNPGSAAGCYGQVVRTLERSEREPEVKLAFATTVAAMASNIPAKERAKTLADTIEHNSGADSRAEIAASLSYLSTLFEEAKDPAEAFIAQKRAVAIFQQSNEAKTDRASLATLQERLGQLALARHNVPDAKTAFAQAITIRRTLAAAGHWSDTVERAHLAEDYIAMGQAALLDRQSSPQRRDALAEEANRYFELCRSRERGAGIGLKGDETSYKLLRAKCFANQGKALDEVKDPDARRILVLALSQIEIDLTRASEAERKMFLETLDAIANIDEQTMLSYGDKSGARRRTFVFRNWIVVAKRELFSIEPSRANRDALITALVNRAWYYLTIGDPVRAADDADAATYLDRSNVQLKFARAHAALLGHQLDKAKMLYAEAARLIGPAKARQQLRADVARLRRAGVGSDQLFTLARASM